MFAEDHQQDWDAHLRLLLMAYRTAIHEPSFMLGQDLKLHIVYIGHPEEEPSTSTTVFAEELEKRLEQAHKFARTNLKMASDRMTV